MDSVEISELLRDGASAFSMLAEIQGDPNHLKDAEKMEAAADNVDELLEQSYDRGWMRSLEKMHKKNAELRAQLARCVELISDATPFMRVLEEQGVSGGLWNSEAEALLKDESFKQVKLDAEILHMAPIYIEECYHSSQDSCPICKEFADAVRAAKELL